MLRNVRHRVQKWWAALALLSVEVVVILTAFSAALLLFAWLVRRVFVLEKTGFDERAFSILAQYVGPITTEAMRTVTFLGTHYFLIPANLLLIVWFLFIRRHKWYSIKVPAIAISSVLMMLGLKEVFGRSRPLVPLLEAAKGFSFPSGHAFVSTTFYGLLAFIAWHDIRNPALRWATVIGLAALVIFIGLSRIYLRVHYASDVLAGFCLGIAWLVIAITVIRRMERWSKKKVDPIVVDEPAPQMP